MATSIRGRKTRKLPIGLAIALVASAALLALPASSADCSASCEWGYGPSDGPPKWGELCCPVCDGKSQSPIDIRSEEVVPGDLGPLAITYRESHLEFSNDGHTLQATYELLDGENYLEVGGERYPLKQLHFHSLSEHTIDGRSAPMEIHFVHRRTSYDLAVVAVLVEEGPERPAFNPLWNSLPRDRTVEPRTVVLNPRKLMARNLDYYTYRGSLATPDCSEVVTWFVLKQPMRMSSEQIEEFRTIFAENYRPTQPLNGRIVSSGE